MARVRPFGGSGPDAGGWFGAHGTRQQPDSGARLPDRALGGSSLSGRRGKNGGIAREVAISSLSVGAGLAGGGWVLIVAVQWHKVVLLSSFGDQFVQLNTLRLFAVSRKCPCGRKMQMGMLRAVVGYGSTQWRCRV